MTPQRWQQIDHLFHSALEHESGERAAFLTQACTGDEALRRELESLGGVPISELMTPVVLYHFKDRIIVFNLVQLFHEQHCSNFPPPKLEQPYSPGR